ncbi:MAG: sugar ABC transporter substrate-binding protein, partial [Anaerolineae bacterium]|nr:sugar ABC transporter substrate-binding protein [Anaerolineae bacterium]
MFRYHRSYGLMLLVVLTLILAGCSGGAPLPGTEAEQESAGEPAEPAAEEEVAQDVAEEPATEEEVVEEEAAPSEAEEAMDDGELNMVLLPKFLGILVFDQANQGAMEANAELGNPANLEFLGPTPENSVAGQIEIVTTAATQGVDAIMISNNAGDQIA